jgi:hypothetical protein
LPASCPASFFGLLSWISIPGFAYFEPVDIKANGKFVIRKTSVDHAVGVHRVYRKTTSKEEKED